MARTKAKYPRKKSATTVLGKNFRYNVKWRYNQGKELGRGTFGVTYLVTDKETQEAFACKSISKKSLKTAADEDDMRREVAIMQYLPEHPSIVTLRAAYEDDDAVHLVMELCEGRELFDRIVARGNYTEPEAKALMRTVAEAVATCHRHGVMHRDLKPENFLFANTSESSPLKVIDFGLSVFFNPGQRFSEVTGSYAYMAPEMLARDYGPEVDVWSAGVILYILLSGMHPFWAETVPELQQNILHGSLDFETDPWPRVSESAKSLVRHMLERDPSARYTSQEVLNHPWLHAD